MNRRWGLDRGVDGRGTVEPLILADLLSERC